MRKQLIDQAVEVVNEELDYLTGETESEESIVEFYELASMNKKELEAFIASYKK